MWNRIVKERERESKFEMERVRERIKFLGVEGFRTENIAWGDKKKGDKLIGRRWIGPLFWLRCPYQRGHFHVFCTIGSKHMGHHRKLAKIN